MPKVETPDVIGSAEAADILNVDRSTLARWARQGRVHAIKIGHGRTASRVYQRAEIEALKLSMEGGTP